MIKKPLPHSDKVWLDVYRGGAGMKFHVFPVSPVPKMHTKRCLVMPATPSSSTRPLPQTTRSLGGGGRHSMFSRASALLELDPLFGQKFFESFDRLGGMSASRLDPPTRGGRLSPSAACCFLTIACA